MARPVNITRTGGGKALGGGKAIKESVVGLKDLERKLKALSADSPELALGAQVIVKRAAGEVRSAMKSAAIAAGWPSAPPATSVHGKWAGTTVTGQDVIDRIFSFGRPKERGSRRVSALAGVTKAGPGKSQGTLFSWRASRSHLPTRSPRKVAPGGEVAMSLATALEFGNSRRRARPALRTAIAAARQRVVTAVADGFKDLIDRFAR